MDFGLGEIAGFSLVDTGDDDIAGTVVCALICFSSSRSSTFSCNDRSVIPFSACIVSSSLLSLSTK